MRLHVHSVSSVLLACYLFIPVSASAGELTLGSAQALLRPSLNVQLRIEGSKARQEFSQSAEFDTCSMSVRQERSPQAECSISRIDLSLVDTRRITIHGPDIFCRSVFPGASACIELVRREGGGTSDLYDELDCNKRFKQRASNAWLVARSGPEAASAVDALRAIVGMCAKGSATTAYDPKLYEAQQHLIELGYAPGAPDGVLGNATQAAISKFQADAGLSVNGRLDQETADKLAFHFSAATEQGAELPRGIRVVTGDLTVTGTLGTDGRTFKRTWKIQQYYVWNDGASQNRKLIATILLYDIAGKQVGTLTREGESPGPGHAWAFYIEVDNNVASTKVSKIAEE